jgi:hypothetical protein
VNTFARCEHLKARRSGTGRAITLVDIRARADTNVTIADRARRDRTGPEGTGQSSTGRAGAILDTRVASRAGQTRLSVRTAAFIEKGC